MKITLSKDFIFLILIFCVALAVRFLYFHESTYFGYDEARDAYVSQEIYTQGNLKLLGPTTFFPGLNHGPLHWYIIGPVYRLSHGDPYIISAFFRIANASFVFFIFAVATLLFNKKIGFLSSILYAFSFEETQYALYMGNPSLAVFSWLLIFLGTGLILHKKSFFGIVSMVIGISTAIQFEFILIYTLFLAFILIFVLRKKIELTWKQSILSIFLFGMLVSNFIIAELKFGFLQSKTVFAIFTDHKNVMESGQNKLGFYSESLIRLFHDNGFAISSSVLLVLSVVFVIGILILNAKKNIPIQIVLIWIFSGILLLPFGAYNAYYIFVGLGIGVLVALGYVIHIIDKRQRWLAIGFLSLLIFGNLSLIRQHNKNSLIVEIKAQQGMKLTDEVEILDQMYLHANGKKFTIRVTSMPYKIQTVWAYLFNWYGKEKYGYLPLWETGLVEGFPGSLPLPANGTTCVRFLLREPVRGIPEVLINNDEKEENYFSSIIEEKQIGLFNLQIRKAFDQSCYN